MDSKELSFNWLKVSVPQATKDCVAGYIRETQRIMPKNNPYYNIPSLIKYVVIYYYYQREIFNKHGKLIKLTENNTVATKEKAKIYNNVFGSTSIDFSKNIIYKWEFKILDLDKYAPNHIGIGICCQDDIKPHHYRCFIDENDCKENIRLLCWNTGGTECTNNYSVSNDRLPFIEDDIVKMELNTTQKTFTFTVNDKESIQFGITKDDVLFSHFYVGWYY